MTRKPRTWYEVVRSDPESAFLEAVVRDLVEAAKAVGDEDPPEMLEEWCAEAAVRMLGRIQALESLLMAASYAKEHGHSLGDHLEEAGINRVPQDLANDPALLEALEAHSWRIGEKGVADVLLRCCLDARDYAPRHPLRTRAGLRLRARYPELVDTLLSLLAGSELEEVLRAVHAEHLALESAGADADVARMVDGLRERFGVDCP